MQWLDPHSHQGLVLLGSLMPFAQAAKHLETLLSVKVRPSTVRRLTEEADGCLQRWQDQQAHPRASCQIEEPVADPLTLATDGVLVPVRPKEWTEVKMVTIGEVQEGHACLCQGGTMYLDR